MRYAIFSDVHNECSALERVLAHAQKQGVDGYFCLGDIGVDNCVELVRQVSAPTVFGNWEVAHWSSLQPINQRWALNLPPIRKYKTFWLTHAAPFWPSTITSLADFKANRHRLPMAVHFPYLYREMNELWNAFATLTEANIPLMFHGHTHRQIIWRFSADNQLQKLSSQTITLAPEETFIIGVGSVGRPLGLPGAAYVIYDEATRQIDLIRLETVY